MRLFIQPGINMKAGRGKFLQRLIPELEKLGVKCRFETKKADITLSFVKFTEKTRGIPRILRVNGVHLLNTPHDKEANKVMARSLGKATEVIWQSAFSRLVAHKVLHIRRRGHVIHNGANPGDYRREPTDGKHIVLSGSWYKKRPRPEKGLKRMIKVILGYPRLPSPCRLCSGHCN